MTSNNNNNNSPISKGAGKGISKSTPAKKARKPKTPTPPRNLCSYIVCQVTEDRPQEPPAPDSEPTPQVSPPKTFTWTEHPCGVRCFGCKRMCAKHQRAMDITDLALFSSKDQYQYHNSDLQMERDRDSIASDGTFDYTQPFSHTGRVALAECIKNKGASGGGDLSITLYLRAHKRMPFTAYDVTSFRENATNELFRVNMTIDRASARPVPGGGTLFKKNALIHWKPTVYDNEHFHKSKGNLTKGVWMFNPAKYALVVRRTPPVAAWVEPTTPVILAVVAKDVVEDEVDVAQPAAAAQPVAPSSPPPLPPKLLGPLPPAQLQLTFRSELWAWPADMMNDTV